MMIIVQDWQDSGLSQIEYARNHNITLLTLRYWISRLRQTSDTQGAFVQFDGICTQGIHIRYPHGVELILPVQVPAEFLRSLIYL